MKRAVRITLQSLFFLVFLTGMGTLLYLSAQKRHRISCSELRVNIVDGEKFVSAQQIDAFILRSYGVCRGERIDSIGLDRIERLICSRDEVKGCEAWVTDDGVLHVDVLQRTPVMRFNKNGEGYYVDAEGYVFPLGDNYEAPVPVIDSDLKKGFDSDWLHSAIALVTRMSASPVWKDRIVGYEVDGSGDFILRSEQTCFIWGDFADGARKLSYLEKYYDRILPRCSADDTYTTVNLKYKGQIICRKD
ncbi:MAG: cell division protein FtsQ/DivIB [Candidatus Cryptobacteroides sp.]